VAKRQTRCVQGAVSITDVWVQIPPSAPIVPSAQLRHGGSRLPGSRRYLQTPMRACSSVDRALPCGGRGRGFESRQAHHNLQKSPSPGGGNLPPALLQPTGGLKEVSARPLVRIGHLRADGPPAFCHSPHPGLLLAQMLHHESHNEVPPEYLGSALDLVGWLISSQVSCWWALDWVRGCDNGGPAGIYLP
jgi:hypothetical protein